MAWSLPPILPTKDGCAAVQDNGGLYVGARLKLAARLNVVADPMRKAWRVSGKRGARIRGQNGEKVEGRWSESDVVCARGTGCRGREGGLAVAACSERHVFVLDRTSMDEVLDSGLCQQLLVRTRP